MRGKRDNRLNAPNERMKYKYRIHIKRIGRKDMKTVLEELKHIRDFEKFIDFAEFKVFDDMVADGYINKLLADEFSLNYIDGNLRALKNFLMWLKE